MRLHSSHPSILRVEIVNGGVGAGLFIGGGEKRLGCLAVYLGRDVELFVTGIIIGVTDAV